MICGCGSEVHVFAGIASSVEGTDVRVLTNQKEAERWNTAMRTNDLKVTFHRKGKETTTVTSKPALVTNDQEVAIQDVDIVNIDTRNLKVSFHRKGNSPSSITFKPALVTNHPEVAMQDVDIVAFVLPECSHEVFLDAIKPYIKPGIIIVGLPGGPGFEFQVREVLGDEARQCTIVNFESSPWVCRTSEFDVNCEVLGTKETLQGAMKVRMSLNA